MSQNQSTAVEKQAVIGKRNEFLDVLAEDSYAKTDLTDAVNAPKSTVYRAVNELEEEGFVKTVDGEYTATAAGRMGQEMYHAYTDFCQSITTGEGDEIMEVISNRVEYLEILEDNAYRKTELVDEVSDARSTMDRAVRELEEHGLVERIDGEFTATDAGETALDEHQEFVAAMGNLSDATKILNEIDDSVTLPSEVLVNADVDVATRHMPEQPVLSPQEMITESPYLQGLAPVAMSLYTDSIQDMLASGIEYELVVTESVLETVQNTFSGDYEELLEFEEQLDVFVTDTEMPFAMWFIEYEGVEYMGLTVYNETGVVGVITTPNETAIEWGKDLYEEFKNNAQQFF